MQRDYYQILGVGDAATPEEIKRAYRKKAFELHPDRHGGNRQAEEAFKELTEAYAVLGDPQRRGSYDAARAGGGPAGAFRFDPGDAFAGLFRDPAFRQLFEEMTREFGRQGLRFDEAYVRRVFHGSRGPMVFGGVFFAGPLSGLLQSLLGQGAGGRVPREEKRAQVPARKPGLLQRLLQAALPRPHASPDPLDVHYRLSVQDEVLTRGGEVRVSLPAAEGSRTYRVRVPAGTAPGTRLRLGGKGRQQGETRGDLYLEVQSSH